MSIHCIVNADNLIINRIRYDTNTTPLIPHPSYPDCQVVESTGTEQIGWTYTNETFLPPPIDPISPPPPQIPQQPSLEDLHATIQLLQQQIATLMGSK